MYHTHSSLAFPSSAPVAASKIGRQKVRPRAPLLSKAAPAPPHSAPTHGRQAAAISHCPHLLGAGVAILLALETRNTTG